MIAAILISLAGPAQAAGFSLETRYTSAFGPDSYGTAHLQVDADPAGSALQIGALGVGGTQPAWLGTAARTWSFDALDPAGDSGPRADGAGQLQLRTELRVGMLREFGPSAGGAFALSIDAGPLTAVGGFGFLPGMGVDGRAGVDAPLSDRWTLQPRIRLETWAGERDPAIRAELGARYDAPGGLWIAAAASGGGRDVLHMGPGAALTIGRSR